jgi:hypothetical protein
LIARGKTVAIALVAALDTVACATAPDRLDAPKVVVGLDLAPYAMYEECVLLQAGQRIGYLFRAAAPLAFNIHFHDGNAVIEPVSADSTQGESRSDLLPDVGSRRRRQRARVPSRKAAAVNVTERDRSADWATPYSSL